MTNAELQEAIDKTVYSISQATSEMDKTRSYLPTTELEIERKQLCDYIDILKSHHIHLLKQQGKRAEIINEKTKSDIDVNENNSDESTEDEEFYVYEEGSIFDAKTLNWAFFQLMRIAIESGGETNITIPFKFVNNTKISIKDIWENVKCIELVYKKMLEENEEISSK